MLHLLRSILTWWHEEANVHKFLSCCSFYRKKVDVNLGWWHQNPRAVHRWVWTVHDMDRTEGQYHYLHLDTPGNVCHVQSRQRMVTTGSQVCRGCGYTDRNCAPLARPPRRISDCSAIQSAPGSISSFLLVAGKFFLFPFWIIMCFQLNKMYTQKKQIGKCAS